MEKTEIPTRIIMAAMERLGDDIVSTDGTYRITCKDAAIRLDELQGFIDEIKAKYNI